MDGDIQPRTPRERGQRLLTDVSARGGWVARAFRAARGILQPRALRVESTVSPVAEPRRLPWVLISFIACVVVPSAAYDVYIALIASDQYVAEARAVVRSAEQEAPVQGAMSASGASSMAVSTATPNAYIVSNYIKSRAAVDELDRTVDLRATFRRPEADFWARLESDASIEEIVDYWQRMVTTYVDGPSGIITVKVRAFRRDDALALTQAVLKQSERLVNEISERARRDAMRFAEREVRHAEARVQAALAGLRRYRDEEGLIDPVKTADETSKLMMSLLTEKIRLESDLFVAAQSLRRDAPSIQNLAARIEIINVQIAGLKAKLTGDSPEARNVAASLARFEELEVQRQFAERLYTMAQDGLERARMTAERQAVYLSVFVPPSLPEDASFPRRLAYALLVPLALFILWSIVALIWASVEDHRH